MSEITAIDRMYDALGKGDVAAVRAVCTPDARFWHSFDQVAHDLDSAAKDWEILIANSSEREIADIRRVPIPGGFLQQHLFVMRTRSGHRMIWPICLVVRIENGLIARIEEYIDRAGSFASDEETLRTPGF